MSKEISISRKTIRTIVWILIISVILVGIELVLCSRPDLVSGLVNRLQGVTSTTEADSPDAQAAVAGVMAFYSLDYTVPVGKWEDAVCATLTASGCDVFKALYSPGLRTIVEKNQWQTSCTTRAIQMVEDSGYRRVWLLEVTQDHPLKGSTAVFQVYAEVAKGTDGTWLMTHVLNDGEASRFAPTVP